MRRLFNPIVLGTAAVVIALAVLLGAQFYTSGKAQDAQQQANSLAEQVTSACARGGQSAANLARIGACRTASDVKRDPAVAAVPGAQGVPGPPGATGPRGRRGIAGTTGKPGATGKTGATGEQGKLGDAGLDGGDGAPGKDGQPGPPGADGAPGKDGADGTNGTNGKDGSNGQPPVSWSTTRADGTTETCRRSSSFDPSAPTYTCTTTTGG